MRPGGALIWGALTPKCECYERYPQQWGHRNLTLNVW